MLENGIYIDRPIQSAKEDLLGRSSFVSAITNSLCRWEGADSLVVGIEGPWGSGKSSIKNLVCERLDSIEGAPRVVEFNPWRIADIEGLARAFFHDVGLAIGRAVHKDRRRIAAKWNYYGEIVSTGATLTATLSKALPILLRVRPITI